MHFTLASPHIGNEYSNAEVVGRRSASTCCLHNYTDETACNLIDVFIVREYLVRNPSGYFAPMKTKALEAVVAVPARTDKALVYIGMRWCRMGYIYQKN